MGTFHNGKKNKIQHQHILLRFVCLHVAKIALMRQRDNYVHI